MKITGIFDEHGNDLLDRFVNENMARLMCHLPMNNSTKELILEEVNRMICAAESDCDRSPTVSHD